MTVIGDWNGVKSGYGNFEITTDEDNKYKIAIGYGVRIGRPADPGLFITVSEKDNYMQFHFMDLIEYNTIQDDTQTLYRLLRYILSDVVDYIEYRNKK